MWAKYKAVIIIWLSGGCLLGFTYYGYISGQLTQFEFARLMYLTAVVFYMSTISLMVTVIKFKELCGLERELNLASLKLNKNLMDQCELLMADNRVLLEDNQRLDKIHPIRERKHD